MQLSTVLTVGSVLLARMLGLPGVKSSASTLYCHEPQLTALLGPKGPMSPVRLAAP